jgi:two-component system, NtrC family, sensor kinase
MPETDSNSKLSSLPSDPANQQDSDGVSEPRPYYDETSGLGNFPTVYEWWRSGGVSISTKLIILIVGAMFLTLGVLGYLNIQLHKKHLEATTLTAAERISDVVKRSTSYHMMRNDRQALYEMISTMADEPGMRRIRVVNPEGRISFSSDPREVDQYVDKSAEACYGCHAQAQPLTRLNRPDRFRIFKADGSRVLAIITPIENEPTCSNAACHAHPASQQILGVLDTNLSLAKADASILESSQRMLVYTFVAVAFISVLSWLFVFRVVHQPIKKLTRGTEHLAKGDLGFQLAVDNADEVGQLASSFNTMSSQLLEARNEITAWTHTLEKRVDQKTRELRRANDQMIQVEKMVAIGKLAAVVAHEVNNPLSGILTYSKLLKKYVERGIATEERKNEVTETLDLIASESRRCGDLVRNLLTYSRTAPMNLGRCNVNEVVDRCLRLVQPKLEMGAIQVNLTADETLPEIFCDNAQVEQVLLALVMNAIDAMPHGGNLWITTRRHDDNQIELEVRDDGMGIPADVLPQLFEPFMTTKEVGKGVGLGLAISKGIVERHGGRIDLRSELGKGTTFTVILPLDARSPELAGAGAASAATSPGRAL